MTSEYLKEFEKLNTTTESIYDLGDFKVLIILKDGTNLTDWKDVKNKNDIIYVSEDLSYCTNLSKKYYGLNYLKAIVVPKISYEVTDMSLMFSYCYSLTDVSSLAGWDTTQVTNMEAMFYECSALSDLTALSNWNTSKVTNMKDIFDSCSSLTDLSPISDWDTSKVTNMEAMFWHCSSLADLFPISDWDTSKVTNMSGMFWNCLSLADLFPISDWDVANTNRKDMFKGCPSVKTYPKWY